ncbi:MAG: FAD-dependent monooxygenase [Candidatus Protistobacter heckmanni]|nr:FAD-dependent monooxygenase [Candidatus Protistobacter heckmanni]
MRGGGPAEATLAAELGFGGAACLLIDQNPGGNPHPRANMAGQRTMEVFRRWGLAEQVLDASLPRDYLVNVVFTTRLNGYELNRFSLSSILEFQKPSDTLRAELPDVEWSPYFKTQIGQNCLEPVTHRFAASFPGVEVRQGWKLVKFEKDADGMTSKIVHAGTGETQTVRSAYLVGCDGGCSLVRKSLGIAFEGPARCRRTGTSMRTSPVSSACIRPAPAPCSGRSRPMCTACSSPSTARTSGPITATSAPTRKPRIRSA